MQEIVFVCIGMFLISGTAALISLIFEAKRIFMVGDEYPKPEILNLNIPFSTLLAIVVMADFPSLLSICTSANGEFIESPQRHLAISCGMYRV